MNKIEWGCHIELTALADALGTPILITDSVHEEQYQVWIYPNDVATEVILLGYSYIKPLL